MKFLEEHTQQFAAHAAGNIDAYLGMSTRETSEPSHQTILETSREVVFSLHYTGSVYGEYVIAMDESVAWALVGEDPETAGPVQDSEVCDALMEILNVSAGQSIAKLQDTYSRLTITAPRVMVGEIRYPNFQAASVELMTDAGLIKCFFCLDTMRLDLSTSYEEAMESLVRVNDQLRNANRTLQHQQAQLVHAEKMASLGVLASGVAHEINNPLFFIESNLETLEEYVEVIETTFRLYEQLADSLNPILSPEPTELGLVKAKRADEDLDFVLADTKDLMVETTQGVRRIKTVVQGLRDFSPMDQAEANEANLTQVLKTAVDLVQKHLPGEAKLECQIGELAMVHCNPSEIGQVFTGVLLNAVEAISESGLIEVETQTNESEIAVIIRDNGTGIDPEYLPMLFDPFYSTKASDGHTGLGLSIAHGIVRRHGGQLRIRNRSEGGVEVIIQIPIDRPIEQIDSDTSQTAPNDEGFVVDQSGDSLSNFPRSITPFS